MVRAISLGKLYLLQTKMNEISDILEKTTRSVNEVSSDFYKYHIQKSDSLENGIISEVLMDISKKSDNLYYELQDSQDKLSQLIDKLNSQPEEDRSVSELTLRNCISISNS